MTCPDCETARRLLERANREVIPSDAPVYDDIADFLATRPAPALRLALTESCTTQCTAERHADHCKNAPRADPRPAPAECDCRNKRCKHRWVRSYCPECHDKHVEACSRADPRPSPQCDVCAQHGPKAQCSECVATGYPRADPWPAPAEPEPYMEVPNLEPMRQMFARANPAPRCRLEGCRTTGPGMAVHHPACPAAKREGGGR